MDPMMRAFRDELEKIAAAGKIPFSRALSRQFQKRVGKSARTGRRPISASKFLEKGREGTHKHKLAAGEGYQATMGNAQDNPRTRDELAAKPPKKKGDVPSREDMNNGVKKEDGRDSAAVVPGEGLTYSIGNQPTERTL